jgi:hypothetical protein
MDQVNMGLVICPEEAQHDEIWQALTERLGFELAQKAFNRPRFLEAMKQRQERVNTTILKRVNPLLVQQPQ